MKMAKAVKFLKSSGAILIHTDNKGHQWFSDGGVFFRAMGIPEINEREEVKAMYDLTDKTLVDFRAMPECLQDEVWQEGWNQAREMDMTIGYDTRIIRPIAYADEETREARMMFVDEAALMAFEYKTNSYVTLQAVKMSNGIMMLKVREGIEEIGAIAPVGMTGEGWQGMVTNLQEIESEAQKKMKEQFKREEERAKENAEQMRMGD